MNFPPLEPERQVLVEVEDPLCDRLEIQIHEVVGRGLESEHGSERRTARLDASVRLQRLEAHDVELVGILDAQPADRVRRVLLDQLLLYVDEAGAVAGAHPLVPCRRESVDSRFLHVHGESTHALARAHDEVSITLELAEGTEILATAVGVLHVADGQCRGTRRVLGLKLLQAQEPSMAGTT